MTRKGRAVYKPGEYSRYGNVPATQARTIFISTSFTKPENPKGQWQIKVDDMMASCEQGMKENNNNNNKVNSDF